MAKTKVEMKEAENKAIETPVQGEEKAEVAETEKKTASLPKPSETKFGQWVKAHWKGFAIGAGAAIGAALLAYAKGTSDAFNSLDSEDEDLDEEEDIVDVEASEVSNEGAE